MENKIHHFENRAGGKGWIHIEDLLTKEELNDKVKMYARVTIDPHASIGYHTHQGDGESYFIVSGEGMYNDDGNLRKVGPGDVTWTGDGHSHGIENIGDQDLIMIALNIKK